MDSRPPVNPGVLALGADCTLTEAESLQAALAGLLTETQTVTLDATAVQRIDTAALQLLAAFVRDRRLAGHAIAWCGTEQTLAPAARLLDLGGLLGLGGEPR